MKRNGKICSGGYLTVYLALIMTIMLSLYLALIEGVRSNGIRMEAECIADIGLNSIFAEYHRELYKQYNLFAIDTSYGTASAGKSNTEKHLQEYLERNMSLEDVFLDRFLYKDFMALSLDSLELTKVSILTDEGGTVFRRRAVEAIQDDVGLTLLEELSQWMKTVTDYEMRERDIAAEKKEVDEEIEEYNGEKKQISEKQWIVVDVENPTDKLEEKRKAGILKSVLDSTEELSAKKIATDALISVRMGNGAISQGNYSIEELGALDAFTERFFFQEYLLKYMGCYGNVDEENALEYQIEYLVTGEESDIENLRKTANMLCALREVSNAVYLFGDEEKCAVAELLAAILATAMMLPEITDLLKVTLLLGWAYAESVYDVKVLLEGGKVPLLKDDSTWHYGLENALELGNASGENQIGLSYQDYLRIFMSFTDLNTLTARAMDMVEADIRQTPGNQMFRLDACYDALESHIKIKSAYGYSREIIMQKRY